MKTIDTWFRESIIQHEKLTAESEELKENLLSLPLEEIMHRCASIKKLQASFDDHDGKLHEIMAFIGSEILDNPLIGEYQAALDAAIKEADLIAEKIKHRRVLLMKGIEKIQKSNLGKSEYQAGIDAYTRAMQQKNLC